VKMREDIDTVLFDLGNTLVGYYTRDEFPAILNEAMNEVAECLQKHSLLTVSLESACVAAPGVNYELSDPIVRPLLGRLCRQPVTIASDFRQPIFSWLQNHPTSKEKPIEKLLSQ
jgi:hypothetical protein